jgi:hypothetical protein
MLKYGSWVTSGTAGGRCASTALALDKHTITEHKAAIKRGKTGFSTSLMDPPRNDEDTVADLVHPTRLVLLPQEILQETSKAVNRDPQEIRGRDAALRSG